MYIRTATFFYTYLKCLQPRASDHWSERSRGQREAHTGHLFIGTNNFHQGSHPRWCTAGLSPTSVGNCFGNRRITEAIIAIPPM